MLTGAVRKIIIGVSSGLLASLLVLTLSYLPTFEAFLYSFEADTYDWRIRKIITPPAQPIDEVIILDIDSRTLQELGPFSQWPRTVWASVIDILDEAGVRRIGVDILFDRSLRFASEDSSMVAAIKRHGAVTTAISLSDADPENFLYPMKEEPQGFQAENFTLEIPDLLARRLNPLQRMEPQYPEFANAGESVGMVNLIPDRGGILRRIPLFMRFNDHVYPTFATALALRDFSTTQIRYDEEESEISLHNSAGKQITIPVDDLGQTLIYYHGPYRTFRYISLYTLLHEMYPTNAQTNILEFFRGKVVFVGASAAGLYDLRATPRQPSFPGVEVHANIFYQLMNGHFIKEMGKLNQLWVILLLGLVSGMVFAATAPLTGILCGIGLGVAYLALAWFSFESTLLWLPIVAPLLTMLGTFSIQYVYRYAVEERSKRTIRAIFSRYVSSNVVEELLKDPEGVKLGGEKRICTVLFSDLAGFTSWSERSEPEELVRLLNQYFTEMTHIIFKNGGTLDKYQGDAIMAIFGAPINTGNHAAQACTAALQMQQRLVEIRRSWEKAGLPALVQRIGINTGTMIVGNMGSDIRFDYTVIGDAVNLGARLEGANKVYGTLTLVSEATADMAGNRVISRPLDSIRVKGKMEPVRIYDLVGIAGEAMDEKRLKLMDLYNQGHQYFAAGKWEWAQKLFSQALGIDPDDGPAKLYYSRCTQYIKDPPSDDWDGIYQLSQK